MVCLIKNSCHKWTFDPNGVDVAGNIKDVNGNIIASITGSSLSITLPSDGYYYADLVIVDGESTLYRRIDIFDFCDLFACVEGVVKDLYCKEDPCCTNCDSAEDEKRRHFLNKVSAQYFALKAKLFGYAATYGNSECTTEQRNLDAVEIGNIYRALKKLIENCGGECSKTVSKCKTC